MTPAQQQLFWREWGAVCRAHGWNTKAGLDDFLARRERGEMWVSPTLEITMRAIVQTASRIAAQDHRSITADALRKAVTMQATGRAVSSKNLNNAQLDRVLALLRLLADPMNLRNVMNAETPGADGARRRHVHAITRAPAAYWRKICQCKHGHEDLDRLTLDELRKLSLTIRIRRPAQLAAHAVESPKENAG